MYPKMVHIETITCPAGNKTPYSCVDAKKFQNGKMKKSKTFCGPYKGLLWKVFIVYSFFVNFLYQLLQYNYSELYLCEIVIAY